MKKFTLSSLLSQLLLLFFVVIWIIPTFGLFISSLRDKDLLAISGWWTSLKTTQVNEIFRSEGNKESGNSVPDAGDSLTVVNNESRAREITEYRLRNK